MTKAFNELYEELRARVVRETIDELHRRWEDDDWRDTKSFTSDEVIDIKVRIENEIVRELTQDIEHCFDEDTYDTLIEIQETVEKDGFTIEEDEE